MTALELSRLQFAVVTVYHYLFVPLSISLATLTALLQTFAYRSKDPRWQRLTLVAGKLLMITFAVGIVTGLVQEFQFGLSWSDFARFYGDVFGPTLAIEGMLAFFLEATFLGLWWFGADRLRPALHLATIWIVAVGTLISAYVILAANAFMQNPVAYTLDPVTGRARLGDFTDLLTNQVVLAAFPHTIAGAFLGGGALLLAIGGFRRWRSAGGDVTGQWRLLVRVGAWTTLVSGTAVALTGDLLGKVMTSVQPMKMAAAEALYATQAGAPFSLFAVGAPGDKEPFFSLDVPWLLSFLATGDPTATVQGIDDLQAQYVAQFGPGDYVPVVPMAYWSFRFMIGFGVVATIVAAWVLWRMRRGRDLSPGESGLFALVDRWLLRGLWVVPVLPALAATAGWLFTETARQPWLVFGLFRTADGVSPGLTPVEIVASLAGFAAVYGLLAVVWVRLVLRVARTASDEPDEPAAAVEPDRPLVPSY
ncbi:cytochrome ubiquinol oxidase subunit I [Actinomycetospora callitridis]|jgi:cytochrome bd ubiquinol oxidase subunit I|uniref:cytochrome ubiquinol oxidase subunit I n=1 Tax=Actinomycetospora callitridis TaxID=913944 RepID=UPI0023663783|nr:cytochrome ubiquinol oxidase subunit I [Actinomycetospora callitridis]MDD7916753.1 cytochrome ubiquinol oxidase subunit I [Actinomycetospora callitridis]